MSIIIANVYLFILFKDATVKKSYSNNAFQQQNSFEKWITRYNADYLLATLIKLNAKSSEPKSGLLY